ncbi:MAG: SDR family NAD(P)-dependent oxidoreductase [Gaiella sp.]
MSELRFDDQVAIVTGGGRGIGRANALLLAARGAAVVVNDVGRSTDGTGSDDPAPAAAVVAEIQAAGGRAVTSVADVATAIGAETVVREALSAFGGLHVVVNNAGVIRFAPFSETTAEDMSRQLALDPLAAFNVTRAAWPQLATQRYGRIVLTSSSAAFGGPIQTAYGTGKSSLIGLGKCIAAAGANVGIRANVVMPYALSRMTLVGAEISDHELRVRERLVTPARVASLVVVLAHERCPVSGEMFAAGGGHVSRIQFVETTGFFDPALTPETVLENWQAVIEPAGATAISDLDSYESRFYGRLPGWPSR